MMQKKDDRLITFETVFYRQELLHNAIGFLLKKRKKIYKH